MKVGFGKDSNLLGVDSGYQASSPKSALTIRLSAQAIEDCSPDRLVRLRNQQKVDTLESGVRPHQISDQERHEKLR